MKNSETIVALQKLKVDCHYNKSSHFNAARREQQEAYKFRTWLIIGTIMATFATIMNVGLWDKINFDTSFIRVVINLLGALGGFFILYTTTFSNFYSKIQLSNKHENVGNTLNLLFKKMRSTEAAYNDNLISDEKLLDQLNDYSIEYAAISQSAPLTKEEDFRKARENFDKGFSEYTDEEMKI